MNIHGQIKGKLLDITLRALKDVQNAVYDDDNCLSHPISQHFHNTLNHPSFLSSIYAIRQQLDREFFMRDVGGREELKKRVDERLERLQQKHRDHGEY